MTDKFQIALFLVIMTAYVMFEKKTQKKTDRIVNIEKEKYEINSLHVYSCYDFIC
jgi:predicted membrane protein